MATFLAGMESRLIPNHGPDGSRVQNMSCSQTETGSGSGSDSGSDTNTSTTEPGPEGSAEAPVEHAQSAFLSISNQGGGINVGDAGAYECVVGGLRTEVRSVEVSIDVIGETKYSGSS